MPKNTVVPGHWVGVVDFAAKLAERGFITFSPHNLYRHGDRFRYLDRKANTIGLTFYSIIIAHHEQVLNWLGTHPNVDAGKKLLEESGLAIHSADSLSAAARKIVELSGKTEI